LCRAIAATISVIAFWNILENLIIAIIFAIILSAVLAPTIGASALHWWLGYSLLWVIPLTLLAFVLPLIAISTRFGDPQESKMPSAPA
jgi:hypothetical protein